MEKYYQEKYKSQDYILHEKDIEIENLLIEINQKNEI